MSPNPITLALLQAAMARMFADATRMPEKPSQEELDALRKRCQEAPLLEVGNILFNSPSQAHTRVIIEEIQKRLKSDSFPLSF